MRYKGDGKRKWRGTYLFAILMLSLFASTTGCTHYRIVPSNKAVILLREGDRLTAPHDGVYVPDALWVEINEVLNKERK